MLSDELASFTVQTVKELTPELIKALFKALEITGCIAKGTGKLVWGATFEDKWADMQADRERLKQAGEQSLQKFLYKYPQLKSCDISQYYNKSMLDNIMRKYRIPYAIQNDKSKMYIPKAFEYVWLEAEKELRENMILSQMSRNEKVTKPLEEKGIEIESVDLVPTSDKKKIKWDLEEAFLDEQTEIENFFKEQVAENKSGFIIQKPSLIVHGDFALMEIENDQFKYVDRDKEIVFNANVIRGVMKSQGIKLDLTDKQINATMKDYIRSANAKMKQIENKFKNRDPLERDFLIKTIIEQAQDPNIRVAAIMGGYDLDKMIALKEANRYGLNPNKLNANGRSVEQIRALTYLKAMEQEQGIKFESQLKDLFKDNELTGKEINVMLKAVIEDPNVSIWKVAQLKKSAREQKEKYRELKTGKPSKQKSRQMEQERSKRSNINDLIQEAHEEKMQMQLLNPSPKKSLGDR